MKTLVSTICIGFLMTTGPQAGAAVVVQAVETGAGVVFTASGDINLNGLLAAGGGAPALGGFTGLENQIRVGQGTTSVYTGILSAPGPFGTNALFLSPDADISGTVVGVAGGIFDSVEVPFMYVSGDPINSTMTYSGETIASLGLIPGVYVWTFGDTAAPDSLTLVIIPESGTGLMAVAAAGILGIRRRRKA